MIKIRNAPDYLIQAALNVQSGMDDGSKFDEALDVYAAKNPTKELDDYITSVLENDDTFYPEVVGRDIFFRKIYKKLL